MSTSGCAIYDAEGAQVRAPIRVLHLRDSPWVDGPGRTILETGSHIDPHRIEYHIGALVSNEQAQHPLVDAARARGLNVLAFRDPGGLGGALIDRLVEAIDRLEIDIVHTSEFRTNFLARLCARKRQFIHVATAHGWIANTTKRRLVRLADKLLLGRCDHVVVVSEATRKLVPRWWLPDERATVLHNALVLGAYGRDVVSAPRKITDPAKEVVIANVGRLSPEKGQEMLLRALHALTPRWPNVRLKFAGIGPLEDHLKSVAHELGLERRVEFVGFVTDMPRLYLDVDLVVQSSYTEGLPNVILEAAYLRVPIVATAVGGTGEVVRHRHSAWLVEPRVDSLVEGIDAFLSNPKMFADFAERAHADIVERFSFEARTSQLMQLYESLVARSRS